MKRNNHAPKIAAFMVATLALMTGAGCTNSDYDLSDIDTTIGIGGDSLALPVSSTEDIMLDDVLELNNSDLIKTEENGDYVFTKEGEHASEARPHINKITVAKQQLINHKLTIDLTAVSHAAARHTLHAPIASTTIGGTVTSLDFHSSDVDRAIKDLSTVGISAPLNMSIAFSPALRQAVPVFKTMKIEFPSYMALTKAGSSDETNVIVLNNVSTARDLSVNATLKRLDFKKATSGTDKLTFTPSRSEGNGTVVMAGDVKIEVTFDDINATGTTATNCYIDARTTLNNITVNSATGKFDPDLELNDLGSIDINSVPDFLTDDDANINLHNPQVTLTVANSMDIEGKVTGTIYAYGEHNKVLSSVEVPEMNLYAGQTTTIVICKTAEGVNAAGREIVVVPTLSNIIAKIPKRIEFVATAHANSLREGTIELGHDYIITPTYSVKAPLAFDEGAQIVYRDTLDGWNDDIKDFSLTEGAYIQVKANIVNRIPANMSVSAYAIGLDGNPIADSRVLVEVKGDVKGTADSQSAVTSPLQVRLYEKQSGALKAVDGLVFKIEASAGEGSNAIVGKTINAKTQTITVRDIRIKLFGKLVSDFN